MKSTELPARKILRLFLKNQRIRNCTIITAFSGGEDSTALLALLTSLKDQFKLEIVAAYLNHGLRPAEELAREEIIIREITDKLNIPLIIEKIAPGNLSTEAGENKLSIEEAARNRRYRFLKRVADEYKTKNKKTTSSKEDSETYIALGHHLNDNVESEITGFFQGSGRSRGIPEREGMIIRPLLFCPKEELQAFLKTTELPHSADSTNFENQFLRNRVRSQLLPQVEEIFPGIKKSLMIRREKQKLLDSFIENSISSLKVLEKEKTFLIDAEGFNNTDPYLRIELIYRLYDRLMKGEKKKGYRLPFLFLNPLIKKKLPSKGILLKGHGISLYRDKHFFILQKD